MQFVRCPPGSLLYLSELVEVSSIQLRRIVISCDDGLTIEKAAIHHTLSLHSFTGVGEQDIDITRPAWFWPGICTFSTEPCLPHSSLTSFLISFKNDQWLGLGSYGTRCLGYFGFLNIAGILEVLWLHHISQFDAGGCRGQRSWDNTCKVYDRVQDSVSGFVDATGTRTPYPLVLTRTFRCHSRERHTCAHRHTHLWYRDTLGLHRANCVVKVTRPWVRCEV